LANGNIRQRCCCHHVLAATNKPALGEQKQLSSWRSNQAPTNRNESCPGALFCREG
jgi:hypothetical protein